MLKAIANVMEEEAQRSLFAPTRRLIQIEKGFPRNA